MVTGDRLLRENTESSRFVSMTDNQQSKVAGVTTVFLASFSEDAISLWEAKQNPKKFEDVYPKAFSANDAVSSTSWESVVSHFDADQKHSRALTQTSIDLQGFWDLYCYWDVITVAASRKAGQYWRGDCRVTEALAEDFMELFILLEAF